MVKKRATRTYLLLMIYDEVDIEEEPPFLFWVPGMSENKPLRILRIIARLNVGGPARHVILLTEKFREKG